MLPADRRTLVVAITSLLAFGAAAAAWTDAGAIPAFARKYRQSCTTCHAPFPRLKAYGEEFAGRGFRMEPGAEPAHAALDVGDPWLEIPRDFPIAVRMDGYVSWKKDAAAEADFEMPWVWKILSGGPLSGSIGYYFYFLVERGEVVGLEDAYLQFNAPFGLPFDVMAGQFQVSDPLFKRELRLERFDYEIYRYAPGLSGIDLTYDRGVMIPVAVPHVDLVLEVVNGNGIGEAGGDLHEFDDDKYKSFVGRLSYDAGPVRIGAFGYWGKQELTASSEKSAASKRSARLSTAMQPVLGVTNETLYYGPDATLQHGDRWELNLQILERRDENPYFASSIEANGNDGDDFVTRGGFAELVFVPDGPDGRFALAALYNHIESDDPHLERLQTASLTANHLLARNVKLMVEGGWTREERPLPGGGAENVDGGRVSIGFVAAF